MQFDHNDDYPQHGTPKDPTPFPPVRPDPAVLIETARIYDPNNDDVLVVQNNVLVGIMGSCASRDEEEMDDEEDDGERLREGEDMDASRAENDDVVVVKEEGEGDGEEETTMTTPPSSPQMSRRAYWFVKVLCRAIYGEVRFAVVLKRRPNQRPRRRPDGDEKILASSDGHGAGDGDEGREVNAEWEVTEERCAVKVMSWNHIRRSRGRIAEDPIQEVAAMQYLKRWFDTQHHNGGDENDPAIQAMMQTNVMMPLDLLTDERYLFSVMPYGNGGEFFDMLRPGGFPEGEARYWMHQILNGLENLQRAGICHRDLSPENLLLHDSSCIIIDMGQCLRVPYEDDDEEEDGDDDDDGHDEPTSCPMDVDETPTTFCHCGIALAACGACGRRWAQTSAAVADPQTPTNNSQPPVAAPAIMASAKRSKAPPTSAQQQRRRRRRRCLIKPQGTSGKKSYMSPEVFRDRKPFDGHAVDMWSAGIILFMILTGLRPFRSLDATDPTFREIGCFGRLSELLQRWNVSLSDEAVDLLQRMLRQNPMQRLSLRQVKGHPWMSNGPIQHPPNNE